MEGDWTRAAETEKRGQVWESGQVELAALADRLGAGWEGKGRIEHCSDLWLEHRVHF